MPESSDIGALCASGIDDWELVSTDHRNVQDFTIGGIVSLYFTLSWGKENLGDRKERGQTQHRTGARRRLLFGGPRLSPESIFLRLVSPLRMSLAVTRTTSIP
jgi:hypothetical protein